MPFFFRRILLILLMALPLTVSCEPRAAPTSSTAPASLTVLAAASLTEAFNELTPIFEKAHPGVEVTYNFAGSQQLAQQLASGAPADVFASANNAQMDAAVNAKRVQPGKAQAFAHNRLVVIVPRDNPAHLSQLQDLARAGLKIVLAAKEVPVGQYSLDFLDKAAQDNTFGAGYKEAVLKNVVSYEENVKSVLTKITLGEADAGIVYTTDITPAAAGQVKKIGIPDPLNVIASYPIAVIQDSHNLALAQAFVDLVLSPQGQQVLAKYGFITR